MTVHGDAVLRIGDRWYQAEVNQPPDSPTGEHPLIRSGDVLRVGHYASLGEAIGFTREDVYTLWAAKINTPGHEDFDDLRGRITDVYTRLEALLRTTS